MMATMKKNKQEEFNKAANAVLSLATGALLTTLIFVFASAI